MIISGFLYTAAFILSLILAVFPNSTGLPVEFSNAIDTLSGYVGILDPLVPVATLATCFSIILLYEVTIFAFNALTWIYKRVPLIGK